jgi:hypothetical protein
MWRVCTFSFFRDQSGSSGSSRERVRHYLCIENESEGTQNFHSRSFIFNSINQTEIVCVCVFFSNVKLKAAHDGCWAWEMRRMSLGRCVWVFFWSQLLARSFTDEKNCENDHSSEQRESDTQNIKQRQRQSSVLSFGHRAHNINEIENLSERLKKTIFIFIFNQIEKAPSGKRERELQQLRALWNYWCN